MNTITTSIEVPDTKLLDTLYQTILVEMEASSTDRGHAEISKLDDSLELVISAKDYVAARALVNSLLRLVKASIDVAVSIEES